MLPTFDAFSLQDGTFITERIVFKGFAERGVIRSHLSRREGVRILGSEFGEKEIEISGYVVASTASELQEKLDDMKKSLRGEEKSLVVESDRTYIATVKNLAIPDEHYNLTKAPFLATFICTNPYATGASVSAGTPTQSGTYAFSGMINISGTFFNRPILTYTPSGILPTGNTLITGLEIYHVESGQTITISGFGGGLGLDYKDEVVVNFERYSGLEGFTEIETSGAYPRWETGENYFIVNATGRSGKGFVGGVITVSYNPRYI